jgi:perosamine synthetase
MIPLFWPQIYKEEWLDELSQVFSTRWIGQGPLVDRFEQEFGQKFGYAHCLSVNSGTAALELAYHLIGIGEGDEVITTCFTCTATNIPLLRRKANIVFADIDSDTLLISAEDVEKKINKNTKAIVVVNLGGLQVDDDIYELGKYYGVPVVVDACQSLGVSESGADEKGIWEPGDYICYSFQAIKHFTTGDGGMLVCRNQADYERAKKLRWFGIDRDAKRRVDWKCIVNHQMAMEIEEAGYKYHMNDIAAAMGLVGLRHSDKILAYRTSLADRYNSHISKIDGYKTVFGGAHWLFAVLTENRNDLMEYLRDKGIESDPVQLRNDVFKVFGGKRLDLPNMNRIENQYLYLPLNCKVTCDNVDYICEELKWWKEQKV